jgi:uncharacterized membrane protein
MANQVYNCFGYGMMNGNYGYGWMIFSWIIGLLIIVGLVLFIVWMIKKMQENKNDVNNTNKNTRRKK